MCKIANKWEAAKKEQLDVLCNDLERWDTQEEREIYILMADSRCCMAETNTKF